jgi:uncharacterized membrane protein YfcA
MIEIIDIYFVYVVILIFSFLQSFLGVGLLLFGTPTLIIFGYSYVETLWMILPSSIIISLTQVIFDKDLIKSKYLIFSFTLPALVIGLVLILLNSDSINISKIVGLGLLLVAIIRQSKGLNHYLSNLISKRPNLYFLFTGLIHGLSNMGGGPLAILMSSLHQSRAAIRTNIAFVYLFFGISQIIVLMIFELESLDSIYFTFPLVAIMSYFFIGKPFSRYIDDNKYQSSITLVIFIYGILAFIDVGSYIN